MYTVSRGSSKVYMVERSRRNLSQKLNALDKNCASPEEVMSSPKPTFNSQNKMPRNGVNKSRNASEKQPEEQEDKVSDKYLQELVNYNRARVMFFEQNLERQRNGNPNPSYPVNMVYTSGPDHPSFRGFKPFNVSDWWSSSLYEKVKSS